MQTRCTSNTNLVDGSISCTRIVYQPVHGPGFSDVMGWVLGFFFWVGGQVNRKKKKKGRKRIRVKAKKNFISAIEE